MSEQSSESNNGTNDNSNNNRRPQYYCYSCRRVIEPLMAPYPTCPRCNREFVEEIEDDNDPREFAEHNLSGHDTDDELDDPFTPGNLQNGPFDAMQIIQNVISSFLQTGSGGPFRVQTESHLKINPPAGIEVVDTETFKSWKLNIDGVDGTLYAGERFTLEFRFSPNYPMESPEVVFTGNVPIHPHVICRAMIINSIRLKKIAIEWRLDTMLKSTESSITNSKTNAKLYAECLEAYIGGYYFDLYEKYGEIEADSRIRNFCIDLIEPAIEPIFKLVFAINLIQMVQDKMRNN
ncbi:20778_t:CDS:2 [Entrophospora sp. SA101]|nr:20778_t:CDS:2 [Entrophospora sp. SA101]